MFQLTMYNWQLRMISLQDFFDYYVVLYYQNIYNKLYVNLSYFVSILYGKKEFFYRKQNTKIIGNTYQNNRKKM